MTQLANASMVCTRLQRQGVVVHTCNSFIGEVQTLGSVQAHLSYTLRKRPAWDTWVSAATKTNKNQNHNSNNLKTKQPPPKPEVRKAASQRIRQRNSPRTLRGPLRRPLRGRGLRLSSSFSEAAYFPMDREKPVSILSLFYPLNPLQAEAISSTPTASLSPASDDSQLGPLL